jgi:hypothetical protein
MEFTLKLANMAKPAGFTLYPYRGNGQIQLQSDKRFAIVQLATGDGIINPKGQNYPNGWVTMANPLKFKMTAEELKPILEYLRDNGGIQTIGGVMQIENKPLPPNLTELLNQTATKL